MAELSQFAIQTYRYLVNNTDSTYQHTIYPWATTFQHQRAAKYAVSPVRFPDVLPNAQNVRLIEGDFTKSLSSGEFVEKYDAVVTLYFIDTARNFLEYAETIRRVLKPGGIWINLGRAYDLQCCCFFFRTHRYTNSSQMGRVLAVAADG